MQRVRLTNIILFASGLTLAVCGVLMLVLGGGSGRTDPPLPDHDAAWLAEGEALVKHYNCNFCHRTELPETHPPRDNCQLCHQQAARAENLAPPLANLAERRSEEWLRRYLRYPYAIRENSADRMPDFSLSDREIEVLTRYMLLLAADGIATLPEWRPETGTDAARLAAGRALWEKYDCAQCHSLGGERVTPAYDDRGRPLVLAQVFAPDLSDVRNRVRPEWLAEGIRHPDTRLPFAGMPQHEMPEADARLLAWFVVNAVQPAEATVMSGQVMDILRRNCVGCHYGPDPAAGPSTNPEGGAGWLATWSDKPRKLDLTSLEGLMRGAVDDLGRPRLSVVPYAENSPLLMHIKGHKHPRMPFGMDPLPASEIKLIEDWVMSGAKP